MKQLKCEMCGSTDLVKQDGMFVCQVCGTRYSVEEAKKMMIEGTVDVSGSTVKIDISDELAKLYKAARSAKDDDSRENAVKYYDMILEKDPASWEAAFYVVYFKAIQCTINEIESAALSVNGCIKSVIRLIKENVAEKENQTAAVKEVADRCTSIAETFYNAAQNYYNGLNASIRPQFLQQYLNNCYATKDIMYFLGDSIDMFFGEREELHSVMIDAWKNGIIKHNNLMPKFKDKQANRNIINQYVLKIQKHEPTYQPPQAKSGGCYVATCVYGSYDCPEVWTLRRYRDNVLGSTRRGRAFIRCYYAVSPTLVKWFGHTNWFKKLWRKKLDKMVRNLREKGVEDTPYEDIDWSKNSK